MSKYTKDEQTNITGMAAELQAAINAEKEELARLESNKFSTPPPKEPVLTLIEPHMPEVNIPFGDWARSNASNPIEKILFARKFLVANLLFALMIFHFLIGQFLGYVVTGAIKGATGVDLSWIVSITVFLSIGLGIASVVISSNKKSKFNTQKSDLVEEYKRSEEYQREYAAELKRLEPQNEVIKSQYLSEKEKYDNEILPEFQKGLMVWKENNDKQIAFVKADLNKNVEALDTLYSTTQIIPSTYRTLDRLVWLYEDMSTSEHDIERSIDLLNNKEIKEELVHIQDHVDDMRRDLRDGFVGVYDAIQQGNEIQSDMLSNLESIRRGIRAGNFMEAGSLIQNHKRNKMLADIQSKM